jgi:D-glycero-alpha-D-manno-heptose-7-phosphate kinase
MAALKNKFINESIEVRKYSGHCRVDWVGGTTDLWPFYCHLGSARVINMAIPVNINLEISYEPSKKFSLKVESLDLKTRSQHSSLSVLANDIKKTTKQNPLRWVHRLCYYSFQKLSLAAGAWTLSLKSDAPPGSGLGGSSVLGATLIKAIHDMSENSENENSVTDPWKIHAFNFNLEAAEIEKPAGEQDALPALFGGLLSCSFSAETKKVSRYDDRLGVELANRSALIHTGKPHHSGINNWDVFKKYHEGNKKVRSALEGIRDLAEEMHSYLEKGNTEAFVKAVNKEWALRKKLSNTFDVPVLRQAWSFAQKSGAIARKACGAGGGGSLLLIFPNQKIRDLALEKTLPKKDWIWIPLSCETQGLF